MSDNKQPLNEEYLKEVTGGSSQADPDATAVEISNKQKAKLIVDEYCATKPKKKKKFLGLF